MLIPGIQGMEEMDGSTAELQQQDQTEETLPAQHGFNGDGKENEKDQIVEEMGKVFVCHLRREHLDQIKPLGIVSEHGVQRRSGVNTEYFIQLHEPQGRPSVPMIDEITGDIVQFAFRIIADVHPGQCHIAGLSFLSNPDCRPCGAV